MLNYTHFLKKKKYKPYEFSMFYFRHDVFKEIWFEKLLRFTPLAIFHTEETEAQRSSRDLFGSKKWSHLSNLSLKLKQSFSKLWLHIANNWILKMFLFDGVTSFNGSFSFLNCAAVDKNISTYCVKAMKLLFCLNSSNG